MTDWETLIRKGRTDQAIPVIYIFTFLAMEHSLNITCGPLTYVTSRSLNEIIK